MDRYNRGYTLIETLVALGLFSLVILVAISGLLVVSDANRKAQSTRRIIDSLDFVVEDMVRTVRAGKTYHCGTFIAGDLEASDYDEELSLGQDGIGSHQDCAGAGGQYLAFEGANGNYLDPSDQIVYRLNNGAIQKTVAPIDNVFVPLTDPAVTVTNLKFYVSGSDPLDGEQAKVLIILNAYIESKPGQKTEFNIQTTVTQRATDL